MKILLCNEAHIGDLILSTSVLPALKRAFPTCRLGFLAGSWAKEVVQDHIDLDWLHIYNQASFNRSAKPKRLKKREERKGKRRAIEEIQAIGYDVAIDLHSYYRVNSAHLLFQAAIPERVAYWASGKPFFYNRQLFWNCCTYHMIENHRQMLLEWGVAEEHLQPFLPSLEYNNPIPNPHLDKLPPRYLLIHVGTGEVSREWTEASWRALALKCDALALPLVFIGRGKRERKRIEYLIEGLKHAHNFCDIFSWKQLIAVVKRADCIVGLESMIGHMAAAFNKPALLLYASKSFADWTPYSPSCQVIMAPEVPKGQLSMPLLCPKQVFEKLEDLLKKTGCCSLS